MELKVEIGFDQLLDAVKQLPNEQLAKFKAELEKKPVKKNKPEEKQPLTEFQEFLLSFPVMSDEQYKEYKQIHKEINQWRTK